MICLEGKTPAKQKSPAEKRRENRSSGVHFETFTQGSVWDLTLTPFMSSVPWNLLLTGIWMESVVRKADTLHGNCWMTLRAGVVGMGRSSKAQSVRACTWGLINKTSAVKWESTSRKVQRWRKVCMSDPIAGWLWVSSVMQHEKSKYNHKILQARNYQQGKETITPLIHGID